MAQKTQLTVYGVPGQTQSFIAKTEYIAPRITQLTVMGIPGQVRNFVAKTAAGVANPAIFFGANF